MNEPGTVSSEAANLTIGDMADRTGLSEAALRNWESRYGVPQPRRLPSGQRRYRESDARMVVDILRRRAAGVSLAAAVAQARAAGSGRDRSFFAGLRRRHPELKVHAMDKRLLLALTRAIEDECAATADRPLLLAAFQQQRFFASSQRRWNDLSAVSDRTILFAASEEVRMAGRKVEIPVAADSPVRREWALVCDAPDQPACVVGWEPPGQDVRPDSRRTFEAVWSLDPNVVRQAARIGVGLASEAAPSLAGELAAHLDTAVAPPSADLRRMSGMVERTLDYVTRLGVRPASE